MEVSNHLKKFKLLLEYVFEGKIVLNENNKEKLLKFLEDLTDNSPGRILLDTPDFSDLIFNLLENVPSAPTSVKVFVVEIITILFKNELQFTKMQMQGFQGSSIKYCIIANLNAAIPSPALHLACIKLATVQISHCSGVKLLLEHKVWKHVLYPNIHKRPIQIAKAAYNFVSQLIQKLNEFEKEPELIEVLEYVVKPITSSEYLTVELIDSETDKALADKIYTHLNALATILKDTADVPVNHIVPILRTYLFIDQAVYTISQVTRCSYIQNLINDLFLRLYYSVFRNMLFTDKVNDFCNEMVVNYRNSILQCIKKRDARAVIDFCIRCNIFWSDFEKNYKDTLTFPLIFERNGQKYDLSNQLIVHMLEPLLLFAFYEQTPRRVAVAEVVVEEIITKLGKIITEHIFSSCHLFRTLIQGSDVKQVTIQTIRELSRLKGHLTAKQAGLMFQSLYYVLDIFIVSDGAGGLILNESPIKCPDDIKLLSLVLDTIRMLLKEHNISWYENVEIVSLQVGLMNLLKQNILNTKQLVQVLDLIDLCVKKFLSPNMTLLVESRQDSTLTEIGAVMKMYMQHEDWEVRDSALNLLLSCTAISFIKYIPLQKVISENNLMIYAAKVALTDNEYYAQSTGLKCLAAATKIESIWRDVLIDNPQIYLQLVYILKNNPEGMVRKEAAKVLTRVYVNQKLIENFRNTLYEVMMAVALEDLHWEVQLAALQFWKHAIKNHLSNRGMIDGKFPSVTFSKEKRKIITLDDKEIIRQLTSILNDLSSIGCLTVLHECTNEIYNIKVIEEAYCMARELIEILDKYKFNKVADNAITYPKEEIIKVNNEEMAIDLSQDNNQELRDKVIDSILSMNQSELIMNLHDNYCQTKSDEMDEDYRLYIPRKEMVHPNKFLETFKGLDYLSIIKDKKNWNADIYTSLDVLLNELLDV